MGKIALVLSGGAAKGAYEVGALLALAEMGIKPSVIVGISAGAINGTVTAQLLAQDRFDREGVEASLVKTWMELGDLRKVYRAAIRENDGSLQSLARRLDLDPFEKKFIPKLSGDLVEVFRLLKRGQFVSFLSSGYLRQLLREQLQPMEQVIHPCLLAIGTSNLLGETIIKGGDILLRYSHYQTFRWQEQTPEEWHKFNQLLQDFVVASSSFPFIFPPQTMQLPGHERPGMYLDGGLIASSPIGQAIRLDRDVDRVIVVMSATVINEPQVPPGNIYEIISRVFNILGGGFLTHNYLNVQKINRQVILLSQVLEKGPDGNYLRHPKNEMMCLAAGFASLADFEQRRVVEIIPVSPETPLEGDLFTAFLHREMRAGYIAQGYADAKRALCGPPPPGHTARLHLNIDTSAYQ